MILIGQYDSPFVRRVGIALTLYDLPFQHRPWSAWSDGPKLQPFNPLLRVPTLILADGDVLVDSQAMLDYVDGLVSAEQALLPRTEPARHKALRIVGLATGVGDKAVSLFYELRLHEHVSAIWQARCRSQILGTLAILEAECPIPGAWFGARFGHADIAVVCVLRFLAEAHPGLIEEAAAPRLVAFAAALEATPVFQVIQQPFVAPN